MDTKLQGLQQKTQLSPKVNAKLNISVTTDLYRQHNTDTNPAGEGSIFFACSETDQRKILLISTCINIFKKRKSKRTACNQNCYPNQNRTHNAQFNY